jgi:hypothetical protein
MSDDRLTPKVLGEIERLAQDGLHGGLLEQAWGRRALALVREVRMLKKELEMAAGSDPSADA